MDQVRRVLRYHHYAYRTEQTYCGRFELSLPPKLLKAKAMSYIAYLLGQKGDFGFAIVFGK